MLLEFLIGLNKLYNLKEIQKLCFCVFFLCIIINCLTVLLLVLKRTVITLINKIHLHQMIIFKILYLSLRCTR